MDTPCFFKLVIYIVSYSQTRSILGQIVMNYEEKQLVGCFSLVSRHEAFVNQI